MPRRDGAPEVRIGPRLRAARHARKLTLDDVAAATGVTKGYLSRLERDGVSPSVATLVSVCEVLALRVGELFDPPQTSLVRAGDGREINFGGRDLRELLLTPGTQGDLRVIHSVIEPGGGSGAEPYALDCDVEFVYLVSGELELVLGGEAYRLAEGDAFTFPGREPHTWHNPSASHACSVLWTMTPAP